MNEGRKNDQDKATPQLLSPFALMVASRILSKGAKKYSARNWENAFAWTRAIGGILRHVFRYMMGQTHDIGEKKYGDKEDCLDCKKGTLESMDWFCKEHTGESHMGCVMINAHFLCHFEVTKKEFDDRPKYESVEKIKLSTRDFMQIVEETECEHKWWAPMDENHIMCTVCFKETNISKKDACL